MARGTGRRGRSGSGNNQPFKLAFTSCAKYDDGYFNAYARIAEREDLNLFVHLGDYFYEYATDEDNWGWDNDRRYHPPHDCKTLEDYRARYAHTRTDLDCRRLHQALPWACIFDDHEVVDDRWREGGSNHDESIDGPFVRRAAAALQAWYEWLPVRPPDPDDPTRAYRPLPLGEIADLFLIDCRSYRDQQAVPPATYDQDRELLGPDQETWLLEGLARSKAHWKLVGNPIMVGQVYTNLLPDWLGPPLAELGILTDEVFNASPDQWDGYPAARARLFSGIRRAGVDNLCFLSGDVHTGWAVELLEDTTDPIEPLAVELVTMSCTTRNLNEKVGDEGSPGYIGRGLISGQTLRLRQRGSHASPSSVSLGLEGCQPDSASCLGAQLESSPQPDPQPPDDVTTVSTYSSTCGSSTTGSSTSGSGSGSGSGGGGGGTLC